MNKKNPLPPMDRLVSMSRFEMEKPLPHFLAKIKCINKIYVPRDTPEKDLLTMGINFSYPRIVWTPKIGQKLKSGRQRVVKSMVRSLKKKQLEMAFFWCFLTVFWCFEGWPLDTLA